MHYDVYTRIIYLSRVGRLVFSPNRRAFILLPLPLSPLYVSDSCYTYELFIPKSFSICLSHFIMSLVHYERPCRTLGVSVGLLLLLLAPASWCSCLLSTPSEILISLSSDSHEGLAYTALAVSRHAAADRDSSHLFSSLLLSLLILHLLLLLLLLFLLVLRLELSDGAVKFTVTKKRMIDRERNNTNLCDKSNCRLAITKGLGIISFVVMRRDSPLANGKKRLGNFRTTFWYSKSLRFFKIPNFPKLRIMENCRIEKIAKFQIGNQNWNFHFEFEIKCWLFNRQI